MKGSKFPRISVVTPSFNQGRYLEKTIQSVLAQDYPDVEYIIIDGGSTDNSIDIIKKYETHLNFWVSEADRGQSHAINKGFERATGDIYYWLNSDDCLVGNAFYTVAEMYLRNPNAGAYVGAGEFVNCKGKILRRKVPKDISLELLYYWLDDFQIMQPSCFIKNTAWKMAGGLDESIHFAMDLDLWLKIAHQFTFETTNILLSRSLVHGKAKTTAHQQYCFMETALVILKNGGEKQARAYLEGVAAKLELFEKCLRPLTANSIFAFCLPYIKKIIKYDKHPHSFSNDGQ